MNVKVTLTKLSENLNGMLINDNHLLADTFEILIPEENILFVNPGEIILEKYPVEYRYSLLRNKDGIEKIVFSSESEIPNPWRGFNKLISIQGVAENNDPISKWNCDTWKIKDQIKIDNFSIDEIKIFSLTEESKDRFLVNAAIKIVDNNGIIFGNDIVMQNNGYLLLNSGITIDGPQEIDLSNGKNIESTGAIVKKIEIVN